jgi:hypothetical protein
MAKTIVDLIAEAIMKKKDAKEMMASMKTSNDNSEKHLAPIKPVPKKRDKITIAKPGQSSKGKITIDTGKKPIQKPKESYIAHFFRLISPKKK